MMFLVTERGFDGTSWSRMYLSADPVFRAHLAVSDPRADRKAVDQPTHVRAFHLCSTHVIAVSIIHRVPASPRCIVTTYDLAVTL